MKKVIVIEGPVGAGKTMLFNTLQAKLGNDRNVQFLAEPDLDNVTINGKAYNILEKIYHSPFERDRYLCSEMSICRLLAETYKKNLQRPVLIMDRWIMSCKIFLEVTYQNKLIGDFARDFMIHYLRGEQKAFEEKIKGGQIYKFYLNTDALTCLERIKTRGRKEELELPDQMWLDHHYKFDEIARKGKYYFIGNQREITEKILDLVA